MSERPRLISRNRRGKRLIGKLPDMGIYPDKKRVDIVDPQQLLEEVRTIGELSDNAPTKHKRNRKRR